MSHIPLQKFWVSQRIELTIDPKQDCFFVKDKEYETVSLGRKFTFGICTESKNNNKHERNYSCSNQEETIILVLMK